MHINKYLSLYMDMIFCLVLLPFMIWLLPVDRWLNNNTQFVMLFITWLYALYGVNRFYITPRILKGRNNFILAVFAFVITLIITYIISKYRFELPASHTPRMRHILRTREEAFRSGIIIHQRAVWFLYVVVVTFSFAVGTFSAMFRLVGERQAIEQEMKKAELALYKAQINPHFLFNTLNTLYGLMLTDIKQAETAFMQFMSLTKYMYNNADREHVKLNEEIDYITQYIELQKNRLNSNTKVHFRTERINEIPDLTIAPMLVITFVENAFKYGVTSHRKSDIFIGIKIEGHKLHFMAQNPILTNRERDKIGVGIINCRKRLDLLYPDKHSLEITEKQNNYYVSLMLNLV